MLARCNNPNSESYRNYGGRGVTVCSRWDPKKGGSFENFLTDMGERPDPTYHLDKEAVNMASMEYGPDTTRWVPRIENNRRKRNCRFIEFNGKRMTVSEWAQELGVNSWLIQQRLDLGWSIEKTLTMPSTRPKTRPLAKD
jgi:hypothetical protein